MPRTSEQNCEIRKAASENIVEVAMELFANHGYHATSISMIAKEAKISKGLMYNYFDSKEALLKEIFHRGISQTLEGFDINRDGKLSQDELIYFIKQLFEMFKNNVSFWKLYYSISIQPAVLKIIEKEAAGWAGNFIEILFDHFKKRGAEDPLSEVYFFSSVISGVGVKYLFNTDTYPIDQVMNRVIKMYS